MDPKTMLEVFGYIGSALVVVSMLMSSIVKLRVINTVGSVISGIYAVLCGALPLALMNACLIIINGINLYKLLKTQRPYDLVVGKSDDAMVTYFLTHYGDDIKTYFPDFDKTALAGKTAYMVCCEGNQAGIMLGEEKDGTVDVILDYSIPTYRDSSVGAYLHEKLPSVHVKALRFAEPITDPHVAYMKRMGYVKEGEAYIMKLG